MRIINLLRVALIAIAAAHTAGAATTAKDGSFEKGRFVHVKPGITYALTLDAGTFNDATPVVTVGGQGITLTAGTPFTVNGTSWTPLSGTFLAAKGSKTPLLQVANTTTGAQLVFIDNVTIKPQ
jgi:hypothetical protein